MRILLVADIHANWPALQAIAEPFDLCLCLGDLVDYGVEPAPCIEWARQRVHYAVRGNHDHEAAQNVTVTGQSGFRYLTAVTGPLTRQRLCVVDLRFLADLPVSRMLTLDNQRSPVGPRHAARSAGRVWPAHDRVLDQSTGGRRGRYRLRRAYAPPLRPAGGRHDGGQSRQCRRAARRRPAPAYAIIEDGRVELKRVEYDVEATVRTIQESPLPDQAKEMLGAAVRSGGTKLRGTGSKQPPSV